MKTKYLLIFAISVLLICLFFLGGYKVIFPKYLRVGTLAERLTGEPTLIRDIVNKDERIAQNEHMLNDDIYDKEGGALLTMEYYCSFNISSKVEAISEKTGVTYYKGNLELVSLEDFKHYLDTKYAICIEVLPLNNPQMYGDVKKALSWGLEADDMIIYKKR